MPFGVNNLTGEGENLAATVAAASDGDVIELQPGVYAGPILCTAELVIRGYGEVTIQTNGSSVVMSQSKDLVLEGIHVKVAGQSSSTGCFSHCVVVEHGRMSMRRCTVDGGATGIAVSNSSHVKLDNCVVSNCRYFGCYAYKGSSLTLSGCTIGECGRGISCSDAGTTTVLVGSVIHGMFRINHGQHALTPLQL